MNKNTLLIIGAGKHQIALIKKSILMGYRVIGVDNDNDAEGLKYCDICLIQSAYDYDSILQILEIKNELSNICGVITQAARGCILTVSMVSKYLGLRHLSASIVELLSKKGDLTKALNPHVYIGTYSKYHDIPKDIDFPFVIKWDGASGSSGVHRISDDNAIRKLEDRIPQNRDLIVEHYVQGRSFGIIGLVFEGVIKIYAIVEKFQNSDLTLDMVVCPAAISNEIDTIICDYVTSTLHKLKFDYGPFQLEMILDANNRPFFVELEASVLGSYLTELMIPETSSNDLIADSINLVCNGSFQNNAKPSSLVSVLKYYYPSDVGTLKSTSLSNMSRQVLYKPYFNSNDILLDRRMYVANCFAVGKEINSTIEVVKKIKLNMEIVK